MQEFQRKQSIKKYLFSYLTIILLSVVFLVLLRGTYNIYKKAKQSSSDLALLNARYVELHERNQYLESEINRLSSERGFDQEVRDKFPVSKPDEKTIIIVDQDVKDINSAPQASSPSLWQKFLNLFR